MDKKALEALLNDMSTEEKVMQLVQIPGSEYEASAEITGIERGQVKDNVKKLAGSTLGIWGSKRLKKIQEKYIKEHPHHIPLMFMLDVIHGHKTVLPCPLGQGATFDPDTVRKGAEMQAQEAAADGVHATFSPMADLCRDARWGRIMESTGEDKILNSRMATAMVEGYQGDDLKDRNYIAACVKHYAAYGAAEGGRDYNNTELSEHTLREHYLRAYGEAIKKNPAMVMTSFNSINGIPATGNKFLMKKILREEFGFKGVLISDWGAVGEMINHGFAEDQRDAALKAMMAGVDIDMCSGCYSSSLEDLVNTGAVSVQMLDEAVLRVLNMKNDLGLFEDPYRGIDMDAGPVITGESRALAKEAVAASLVLLENKENTLPLRKEKNAFIGPYANNKKLQSSWAFSGEDENTVTVWEAALEAFDPESIKVSTGCTMLDQDTMTARGKRHVDNWEVENTKFMAEAVKAAEWADTVIMCLGEDFAQSGEATSKVSLKLPAVQLKLLNEIKKTGKRIVTLIFTGRPLELNEVRELSDALMICWLPGTEGGHGVMDVLLGKVSPSGRLPVSFPYTVGQEPLHYDMYPTGRPRPETGPSAFTSSYLDCENGALYPFGYGLSYTLFEFINPTLSAQKMSGSETITAYVTVRNTGAMKGSVTVQLYIRDVTSSRVRPVRELADFKKISLDPGAEEEVGFIINEEMLRFWTAEEKWESEAGKFLVWICNSSRDGQPLEFKLA
ncbi:MAG: glycoside hydrolase family 3 C-terminal domain-containing protein [Lachnospiraceae bacterium]|nr:glycoside hydrolase family 3 C-terminal domain-containing protein [Lachnospiraceae bacterium]